MELNAFNNRLGISQGRLGEGVFVLGDSESVELHRLAPGDKAEIQQETDLSGVDFIRANIEITVPEETPPGASWKVSIVVDGLALATAICPPGRTRRITDLAANVSKHTGVCTVRVRLRLE